MGLADDCLSLTSEGLAGLIGSIRSSKFISLSLKMRSSACDPLVIIIGYTKFEIQAFEALAPVLRRNPHLQRFQLVVSSDVNIGRQSIQLFADALRGHKKLRVLGLKFLCLKQLHKKIGYLGGAIGTLFALEIL